MLHLSAILLLGSSIRQLMFIAELDWAGPVAAIQGSFERLRVLKIRQFKWVMLLAPLVGFCGLIVGLYWLANFASNGQANLLDKLDAAWVVGNYIFGVLFVPAGYFAAGVLAKWCSRHSWWQSVLDGISGTSLKAAAKEVETWANLQKG